MSVANDYYSRNMDYINITLYGLHNTATKTHTQTHPRMHKCTHMHAHAHFTTAALTLGAAAW